MTSRNTCRYQSPIQLLIVKHYSYIDNLKWMHSILLIAGPYYRYRTYRDYFEMPFKTYAPSVEATLEKLKHAVFYCALYLATNYIWPLDVSS